MLMRLSENLDWCLDSWHITSQLSLPRSSCCSETLCSETLWSARRSALKTRGGERNKNTRENNLDQHLPLRMCSAMFEEKPCLSKCAQSLQHMCSTGTCLLPLLLYIFCISKVRQRVTDVLRAETRRRISNEKWQKQYIWYGNKKLLKIWTHQVLQSVAH